MLFFLLLLIYYFARDKRKTGVVSASRNCKNKSYKRNRDYKDDADCTVVVCVPNWCRLRVITQRAKITWSMSALNVLFIYCLKNGSKYWALWKYLKISTTRGLGMVKTQWLLLKKLLSKVKLSTFLKIRADFYLENMAAVEWDLSEKEQRKNRLCPWVRLHLPNNLSFLIPHTVFHKKKSCQLINPYKKHI